MSAVYFTTLRMTHDAAVMTLSCTAWTPEATRTRLGECRWVVSYSSNNTICI